MSQAFVKESDDNGLLHQIPPTIPALINYIKAENKSSLVFVRKIEKDNGVETVNMSNGLSYFINKNNTWEMCL